jgi:hypothetical protein
VNLLEFGQRAEGKDAREACIDHWFRVSFIDVPERAYIEGTLAVYEQRRIELRRDVFVFAYERSAAQCRVVRESLGTPNPVRLRYRTELARVVRETVLAGEPPKHRTASGARRYVWHS